MIKKIAILFVLFLLFSCSSTKKPIISEPMYDVLFGNEYGGASFQFYEIISTEDEFNILLTDEMIQPYVKKADIETCNFILVNMGEKPSGGYTIEVKKVEELSDKIIVTIKEVAPTGMATMAMTKPCYVIKIKSKKPIEIK
ncbi:protease complex subunit PrcB family protein [Flavobacterium sp.]|uniref:protease complex subunit PrcB family protein n=1 Tax=Flavobacterium sp. TaxID=239 RepID=UPI003751E407